MGANGDFEWDDAKDAANAAKHGITLKSAKLLFDDPDSIDLETPARTDALLWRRVGFLGRGYYVCVYTPRAGRIRLISLRRARQNEIQAYRERKGFRAS